MGDTWEQKVVDCECYSLDHVVRFTLDNYSEDDRPELSVSTHLNTWRGFWNRLRCGVKYILGMQQSHGNWDEVLIRIEQAQELRAMINRYEALVDAWTEKQKTATDKSPGARR